MSILIPQSWFKIATHASRDASRLNLSHLSLWAAKDRIVLAATDGHRLAIVSGEPRDGEEERAGLGTLDGLGATSSDKGILIPFDLASQAAKWKQPYRGASLVRVTVDRSAGDTTTVTLSHPVLGSAVSGKYDTDVRWPEVREVMPEHSRETYVVQHSQLFPHVAALKSDYLAQACDTIAAVAGEKKGCAVLIGAAQEAGAERMTCPVWITPANVYMPWGESVSICIMPVRA